MNSLRLFALCCTFKRASRFAVKITVVNTAQMERLIYYLLIYEFLGGFGVNMSKRTLEVQRSWFLLYPMK